MKRKKLGQLLSALEKELALAEKRAEEAKVAASETSKTSRTSWSAAGERDYSQGQADVLEDYYQKIKSVKEQVEEASEIDIPGEVSAPTYVKIVLNENEKEYYLLSEPINLDKFEILTESSPLGKAILGKKVGEEFEFMAGDSPSTGVVLLIE